MKKPLIVFVILGACIACAIIYLNKQKLSPPVPASSADSTSSQPLQETPTGKTATPAPETSPAVSTNIVESAPVSTSNQVAIETGGDDSTNSIHKLVDALLTAKSAAQKHELFQQLIKSGQLEQAIADLKQRMADNPNDPEIPTTLGEAQLNQLKALRDSGGDIDQIGILAMQADQSFATALKIDPQNYEAQLVKSISMTYWPADPTRDPQVVQTLSSLIDRQATMPSQPDFAQTYIYLGNEYQKIGQPDKALATWQLGLQNFPNDPVLQQKISGQ